MEKKRIIFGIRRVQGKEDHYVSADKKEDQNQGLSDDEIDESRAKKVHWTENFIIKENSKYKAAFDMWINLLVAYSCFTTIYYVAFENPKNPYIQIFEILVEIFFGIDILSNFFVEYRDTDTYENVRQVSKIAKRYVFRGPFLIDFVAVFPFS